MSERLIGPRGIQPLRNETTPRGLEVIRNRVVVPRDQVDFHDTTLRDGGQKNMVNYGVEGKLVVAHRIDEILQPNVIEAGWPGANPVDTNVFKALRDERPLQHAKLSSFGMTVGPGRHPENDPQIQHQIDARAPIKTIVGKADIFQVERGLKKPRNENLRMIEETMAYMKADSDTKQVRFDAEHFFSGFRTDPEYALECLRAAAKGGADMVVLCDTMGDAMPEDVELAIMTVMGDKTLNDEYAKHHDEGTMPIGMHAHNDSGLAMAHSLTAIKMGVKSVQGTVTGIGERLGNANLQSLMITRTRKYGTEDIPDEHLVLMRPLAQTVAEKAGIELSPDLEYVGDNAANHKGGLHTAYVLEEPSLYEHDDPEVFGNHRKIPVSAQNGARGIQYNLNLLGLPFKVDKSFAARVTNQLKDNDHKGYDYERAHGSFELLARRIHPDYQAPFELSIDQSNGHAEVVSLNGFHPEAAAFENAVGTPLAINTNSEQMFDSIRGALAPHFPALAGLEVVSSYSKRKNGHIAVYVRVTNGEQEWTTIGVAPSTQKEVATLHAVHDAIEYGLYHPAQHNPASI